MTAPARLDRAAFDALVERRALALTEAAPPVNPEDPGSADVRRDALDNAELLLASASAFADAVDSSGKELPYEGAVVLTGSAGRVVITEEEWKDRPAYWQTVAAGGHGRVDGWTQGSLLLRYLRTGEADDGPVPL